MKKISTAAALSVFLLVRLASFSQANTSLEGVWKVSELYEAGKTISDPEPSVIIFTKTYYSIAVLTSSRKEVEPPKERGKLSDAEKIARFEQWRKFIGVSGTYEIKDSILVMHPIVAMELWRMKTSSEAEIKTAGTNNILITPTADNATRFGLSLKITRLE